jgi:hypothetical protein
MREASSPTDNTAPPPPCHKKKYFCVESRIFQRDKCRRLEAALSRGGGRGGGRGGRRRGRGGRHAKFDFNADEIGGGRGGGRGGRCAISPPMREQKEEEEGVPNLISPPMREEEGEEEGAPNLI